MFAKQDRQFDDIAADPRRRAAAIKSLSFRRKILFWVASATTILIIPSNLGSSGGVGTTAFCALVQWTLVFKFESDLRLLRVIARLHGTEDLPV